MLTGSEDVLQKQLKGVQRATNFIVADPGLVSSHGHHLETSIAFMRGAVSAGYRSLVLGGPGCAEQDDEKGTIYSWFTRSFYELQPEYYVSTKLGSLPELSEIGADLLLAGDFLSLSAGDVVFFHTSTPSQAYLCATALLALSPAKRFNISHLFRYDFEPTGVSFDAAMTQAFQRFLGPDSPLGPYHTFYAETPALAEFYSAVLGLEVCHLPHINCISDSDGRVSTRTDREFTIGILGEARSEKGFTDAAVFIEGVLTKYSGLPVKFVVQTYISDQNRGRDTDADNAANGLTRILAGTKHRTVGYCASDEYEELWDDIDAVLVLYRTPEYARRGSGVFAEGVLRNKIIFANPLLSITSDERRLAVLAVNDLLSFVSAIEYVLNNRYEVAEDARLAGDRRRLKAQPQFQAEMILNRARKTLRDRPVAIHIAPLWKGQGSSHVFQSQIDYLISRGYDVVSVVLITWGRDPVDLLSFGRSIADAPVKGTFFSWRVAPDETVHQRLEAGPSFWTESLTARRPYIPALLAAFCKETPVQVAVVNYPHLMFMIDALFPNNRPRVILETHDVRAEQYALMEGRVARPIDLALERFYTSRADAIVFINEAERESFLKAGYANETVTAFPLIPTTQETATSSEEHAGKLMARAELFNQASNDGISKEEILSGCPLVAFVGSQHAANVMSMDWYFTRVHPLIKERHILLLAGDICSLYPKQAKVIRLGRVEDLSVLYRAADIIIAPIITGTGLPIKILDALAARRPILATSLALRGLGSRASGLSACDDHMQFASELTQLVISPTKRREAAARSELVVKQLARGCDSYGEAWDSVVYPAKVLADGVLDVSPSRVGGHSQSESPSCVEVVIRAGELKEIDDLSRDTVVKITFDLGSDFTSDAATLLIEGQILLFGEEPPKLLGDFTRSIGITSLDIPFSRDRCFSVYALNPSPVKSQLIVGLRPPQSKRVNRGAGVSHE